MAKMHVIMSTKMDPKLINRGERNLWNYHTEFKNYSLDSFMDQLESTLETFKETFVILYKEKDSSYSGFSNKI